MERFDQCYQAGIRLGVGIGRSPQTSAMASPKIGRGGFQRYTESVVISCDRSAASGTGLACGTALPGRWRQPGCLLQVEEQDAEPQAVQ